MKSKKFSFSSHLNNSIVSSFLSLQSSYQKETSSTVKIIDIYLLWCVISGLSQMALCIINRGHLLQQFLGSFISSLATFVIILNSRYRLLQKSSSLRTMIIEFAIPFLLIHLFISSFITSASP